MSITSNSRAKLDVKGIAPRHGHESCVTVGIASRCDAGDGQTKWFSLEREKRDERRALREYFANFEKYQQISWKEPHITARRRGFRKSI